MKLAELLRNVRVTSVHGSDDVEVGSVVADSRQVTPGALFVAIPGFVTDGARFIRDAIARGASVIVSEAGEQQADVVTVVVSDARAALARIASSFYGEPSSNLTIVGITGTSGKTTTSKMVEAIFDRTGEPVGLVGTIEYRAGSVRESADRTTPDAVVLQKWFARMADEKVRYAVMEVSSHALALKRTEGIEFAAAVFTNLSRDHFDFHKDFEDYFAAKKMLFDQIDRTNKCAIVNIDDLYGRRLAGELGSCVISFGAEGDIRPAPGFTISIEGLRGRLETPAGAIEIRSTLLGMPNLSNWMAAVGSAIAVGIPVGTIEEGVAALQGVRGRFERVGESTSPAVLVDYAHKPDALEKLLHAARELSDGRRVVVVFGCGGDRDQGKRQVMGEIAGRLADKTVITSDNPRSEDPKRILQQIEEGIRGIEGASYEIVEDRRLAIERAVEIGGEDGIVIVAGKGHENYQVIGDRIVHFDDREEVESILRRRMNDEKEI